MVNLIKDYNVVFRIGAYALNNLLKVCGGYLCMYFRQTQIVHSRSLYLCVFSAINLWVVPAVVQGLIPLLLKCLIFIDYPFSVTIYHYITISDNYNELLFGPLLSAQIVQAFG